MSRRTLYLSLFIAGLVAAIACGGDDNGNGGSGTSGNTSQTSVATTKAVATIEVSADAGCTARSAFAGEANASLLIIDPCTPSGEVALNSGGRITVDTAGEGYLDFTSTVGEKRIWVLHNSLLLLCTTGPDDDPTAADCISGFGVWNNNNPDTVAITANASVTLVGTYVLIGYLEEADQTIVVPFDGTVIVQGDPDAIPGEGEPVERGAFWSFGAAGERFGPIEEFPELAAALGIESWVVSAVRLAAADGFPPPVPLLAREAVNVLGAGAFGDPEGGDIFLNGIFWEDMGAELTISALMGSRGALNVLAFEFDPGRLEEFSAERGFEQVVVYFDSDVAAFVATAVAEQLSGVGFDAVVEGIDPAEGRSLLTRSDEEGVSAILVTGG